MQELKLTSETCICTEPLTTVDKAVGKHTTTKSVRTQYNPLYVLSKLETTETCKNDLKVKWPTSKRGEKVVNTDLISAKYKSSICFSQRLCSFFR